MRWCLCQVRVDILGNLSEDNGNGNGNGNGYGIGNDNSNSIGNGTGNGIGNGKDDARKHWTDWFNDQKYRAVLAARSYNNYLT